MLEDQLIRPVRGDVDRRRAAGLAAVSGALLFLLVGVAMMALDGQRSSLVVTRDDLGGGAVHEAQSAANMAESDVATFLAAMKAQKAVPKQSDAHALDWNWAPELEREKSVRNWVGSSWVKPLTGDREIKKIAPPHFGSGKDFLAAAKGSIGRASMATDTSQPTLQLPEIQPLHYFASPASVSGMVGTDWNTQDAIKEAKHSVDYVQEAVSTRAARKSNTTRVRKAVPQPPKAMARAPAASVLNKKKATGKAVAKTRPASTAAAKPGDAVPDTVLAKEEHLKAQIASLRNALAKEKAK